MISMSTMSTLSHPHGREFLHILPFTFTISRWMTVLLFLFLGRPLLQFFLSPRRWGCVPEEWSQLGQRGRQPGRPRRGVSQWRGRCRGGGRGALVRPARRQPHRQALFHANVLLQRQRVRVPGCNELVVNITTSAATVQQCGNSPNWCYYLWWCVTIVRRCDSDSPTVLYIDCTKISLTVWRRIVQGLHRAVPVMTSVEDVRVTARRRRSSTDGGNIAVPAMW